jgi:[protein-PII] uridylyltransferase
VKKDAAAGAAAKLRTMVPIRNDPMLRIPDLTVASFRGSMPERYRANFDDESIQDHAAIVARRAGFLVHIEIWKRLPEGGTVLCVVAEDRPGLLSLISASLVVHDIDVSAVKAYTRTHPETRRAEAVDFLWVQRQIEPSLPFEDADVAKIGRVLASLIGGEATVNSVLRNDRLPHQALPNTPTRVTFEGTADDGHDILTVETVDRPGLLLTITGALYRVGVQIVASDAVTRDGRVADRFTIVERDGRPVSEPRRRAVRSEVQSAIEALGSAAAERRTMRPPKPRESP